MFICVCRAVSDRRIRRAVGEGVVSLRDLTRELGVGTCCGKCVLEAREILEEALALRAPQHQAVGAGAARHAERA